MEPEAGSVHNLFDAVSPSLLRLAILITGDRAAAADVVQAWARTAGGAPRQ